MTPEPSGVEDGRDIDRDFDTTSGGLNDETAVSARMARSAVPAAGPGSGVATPSQTAADVAEDTSSTIRVNRAPRPAVPRYAPPPEVTEATVARPRTARSHEEITVRVRRTTANPIESEVEADAAAAAAEAEASTDQAPTRLAYTPNPEELATGYAARPAAPIIASRASHPLRMAQPPIDGEAVDRSIRGKARRRAASLGAAVAFSVVVVACLLAALIASFGH